ncbi:YwqG family protein [Vagococcus bubulae]|nr:YwqG family protein [Vagococcus bubulae]
MKELEKILYNYLPDEDVKQILKSKRQFISLDLVDEPTNLYSSKVGGYGYLPKSFPYPTNKNNQPLSLLAQLNFDELPKLESFPKTGILAFYVDYIDANSYIGLNFDNVTEQSGYKVLYFSKIDEEHHTVEEQKKLFISYFDKFIWQVVFEERKLRGFLSETIPILDIVEFEQFMGESYYDFIEGRFLDEDKQDEFEELIFENNIENTCIGGYPFFTQSDPRGYDQKLQEEYNTLLFQLNSYNDIVMWGDTGVGNFFINDEKLKNKDFSDVLYNWDCY